MIVHADALETSLVNADSKVSGMSSKRSLKLNNQRTFPSVLCRCLFPQSDYGPSNNKQSDDRNNQLLPSSALQSVKLDCSSANEENNEYIPLNVRLPSSAILTDAILSQVKETDPQFSCNNSSKFSIRTWRRFKFSKGKSAIRNEACGHYAGGSALDSVLDEIVKEVDKPVVFSPLPSQIVPDPGLQARSTTALLGPRIELDKGKKCFVIDLDETLVHSSFKVIDQADFKVGVEIDGITHRVYVLKRPHVDTFLSTMANLYECVLFTASLAKYADPVADFIDKWNTFRYRLFRESCVYHRGNYVKDISNLGRPINQVVILDNSPASYMFHAHHAVQISSWFDDVNDRALLDLIPYFERLASHPNVVEFLRTNHPPTSSAAVGSVGLPLGVLGAPSAAVVPHVSESAGRSTATDPISSANSIISSVRRSAIASPQPSPSSEPKPVAAALERREHLTASRVDPKPLPVAPETRKAHSALQRQSHAAHMASVSSAKRLLGPNSVPLCASPVTLPASPSPLSMLTAMGSHRTPAGNALPTAMSLATYVPVSTCMNTPVTISKPSSGNAAKLTVHPSNNSGVGRSTPAAAATPTSSVAVATDCLSISTAARPAPDSFKHLPFMRPSTGLQTSSTEADSSTASIVPAPVARVTSPAKAGSLTATSQSNAKATTSSTGADSSTASVVPAPVARATSPAKAGSLTATSQSNAKATTSSNRAVRKGFFGSLTGTQATGSRTPKNKTNGRQ